MNERERFVRELFDRIAGRYDLLNRIISLCLDRVWRREAVAALELRGDEEFLLDVGCGTGDLTLAAASRAGRRAKVVGLDLSYRMLARARQKSALSPAGRNTFYIQGSALQAPFKAGAFDAVASAFVLRNLADFDLFLHEALRLLKPGGKFVSLDMFPPTKAPFSFLYALYFYRLMPWVGGGFSGDLAAYRYLSRSVRGFARPEALADRLRGAGFARVRLRRFLFGAVCLHVAEKSPSAGAERS